MSKPLELTVYPSLERPMTGVEIMPYREQWKREKALTLTKRLTDAELAAELHRAASVEYAAISDPSGFKPGAQQRAATQCETLHRFATLPHYDEDQP